MWVSHKNATFSHEIFPTWNPEALTRKMHSKITTTWYYQIRSGQSMLRSFTCKYKNLSKCRYGCDVLEDPDHIFFECTHLKEHIQNIRKRCWKLDITYNLSNILTNNKLKILVEKLLEKLMKHN